MPHMPTNKPARATANATPTRNHAEEVAAALRERADTIRVLLAPNQRGGAELVERFIRSACASYVREVERSAEQRAAIEACNPANYAQACMHAALQGLMPDGVDGLIVVRDAQAAWVVSWRGLLALLRRALASTGARYEALRAEVVYREEIAAGGYDEDCANDTMRHRPFYLLGIDEEPYPESIAIVYAVVTIVEADGSRHRERRVLTSTEIAKRYNASQGPQREAWDRWFKSCAKSAALRALLDMLPKCDAVLDALDDRRGVLQDGAPVASIGGAIAAKVRALAGDVLPAAVPVAAIGPNVVGDVPSPEPDTPQPRDPVPAAMPPAIPAAPAPELNAKDAVEALRRRNSPGVL